MLRTVFFLAPAVLLAQSASTTYRPDINGNRQVMNSRETGTGGNASSRVQSINGREVPVERTTEKEISKDSTTRVVERTIERFDANGRPAGTDRILVEEKKLGDGRTVVTETKSVGDLNGRFQLRERRTTETQVSGTSTTTSVQLDRATVNGRFETEEKRQTVAKGPQGNSTTTETVQRPDYSGRFQTVERSETQTQTTGTQTTSNTANYAVDAAGRMSLASQEVQKVTTRPNGGSLTETTVYRANVGASAQGQNAKLLPAEQKVLDVTVGSDGRVTESLTMRRADSGNPGRLGPSQVISETTCTGRCLPQPGDPAATPTTAGTTATNPAAAPAKATSTQP